MKGSVLVRCPFRTKKLNIKKNVHFVRYPKITAFQIMILSGVGAAVKPSLTSDSSLLKESNNDEEYRKNNLIIYRFKSRISLLRLGVDIFSNSLWPTLATISSLNATW